MLGQFGTYATTQANVHSVRIVADGVGQKPLVVNTWSETVDSAQDRNAWVLSWANVVEEPILTDAA